MPRRPALRVLIPSCLACCTQLALAQEAAQNSTDDASDQAAVTLDYVRVQGEKQPYRDLSVIGATKTDAAIRDLPQSVQILNSDLLNDAGVTDLTGALDLSSTISRQSDFGGLWNSYSIRGFAGHPDFGSDFLVNGFSSSRGFNGMRDGANTESVEVLKGPSSALYGRGEPGGIVNISTKKPLFQRRNTIEVGLGSFDVIRGAIDSTGPLSETMAYRLNIAGEAGESFRDHIEYERYLVAPSFLWMISPDTTLSYEIEAVHQRTPFDRGVVAVDGELGVVPVSNFYGEPDDGKHEIKSLGHQVFLTHYFNDDWWLQTGVTYRKSSMKGNSSEVRPYYALIDGTTLRRRYRDRDNEATDKSARFEIVGSVGTGAVTHNLLFGVDGFTFDDSRLQFAADPAGTEYGIDLMNPVYGAPKPGPKTLSISTEEHQKSYSFYAQDQLDLGEHWKALVGARYDHYKQDVRNLKEGAVVVQSDSSVSPRVGLVYQPTEQWSLYATSATSFRPNAGISRDLQGFPAEEGKSAEVGAKWDTGRVSSTLALYRIKKENVLTPDPVDPNNFNMAVGEVESQGVELDVAGQIAESLRLFASYAYTDAHVTKDNADLTGLSQVGRQMPNVPKHAANVMLVKDFTVGGRRASIGGGAQYVGEREGAAAAFSEIDFFTLPSYTVFNAMASYELSKEVKLTLNVDNLLNKEHYVSSYSSYWVLPGTERRFMLNARISF